jgi:hypothetical protein
MSLQSYLATESSLGLTKSERWTRIDSLIAAAQTKKIGYKQLEGAIRNFNKRTGTFIGLNTHQEHLQNINKTPSQELEGIKKMKNKMYLESEVNALLKRINNWGTRSYKIIMDLRYVATGQQLIYHIQDSDHTMAIALNQQQFLQLLESNGAGLNYAKWSEIEKAAREGQPRLDLFKLQVNATTSTLKNFQAPSINLKKDILYQYLIGKTGAGDAAITKKNTWDTTGDSYYAYHARIAELHSQLLAFYKWQYNRTGGVAEPKKGKSDSTGVFFTDARRRDVEMFIARYKKEKLHLDTDAFYKTGDATANATVLIENKVGNAVVSIKTIKNAIFAIAALNGVNRERIAQTFVNMFTKRTEVHTLTNIIQGDAEQYAIKKIQELIIDKI